MLEKNQQINNIQRQLNPLRWIGQYIFGEECTNGRL